MSEKTKHSGGCHCGAVRYEVVLDASNGGRCNCTICLKSAVTSAMVKPGELVVTKGEDKVAVYEWGAKISKRYFCPTCGIHVFGRGHLAELGGDYASVNLNTLDDVDPINVKVTYWDGRHDNWEAGPSAQPYPLM